MDASPKSCGICPISQMNLNRDASCSTSTPSVECLIIKCKLRWKGHDVHVENDRIPKVSL